MSSLQGTVTSRAGQTGDGGDLGSLSDAIGAAELVEDGAVGHGEVTRVIVAVGDTVTAKSARASRLHGGVVDDVGGGGIAVLVDGGDVTEDVTLSQNVSARADLEAVAAGLVPVVVDGVQHGVASELGGTAGEVVDVVVLEGDLVVGASEVQVPVVVSVAGGGVVALAVDVAVGDAHTAGGILAQDDVLAADLVGGDVVDPDQVGAGQGDGITTPDVLGVELRDADVLDDDVLYAVGHAETLALDDSGGARAEDGLVRGDLDGAQTSIVVGDSDSGSVGLVVGAPVVLVDGLLASGACSPGSTSGLGCGALSSGEVEGLGENDDASLGVSEV